MEVSLKKSLYMENTEPKLSTPPKKNLQPESSNLNRELMFIFFLSIVSFLLGSTINHFTPNFEEDKETWIISLEILCGFVMMFILFIWLYLLTSKYFEVSGCLQFPDNYLLLSGLLISFFCIFLITQSKTIQKIRHVADTIWEFDEPEKEETPKEKKLNKKDKQIMKDIEKMSDQHTPATHHRETSLDDVMGMQHLQHNPNTNYVQPNELLPQVDYFNQPQQHLNNQQYSMTASNYENFTTEADKQVRNDYIYGYRNNAYEPMMSGFGGSMY